MNAMLARLSRGQDGYTLVELVIASAIGAVLMSALTSVILTSVMASTTATSRIEASGQIRNFELRAYDDFAMSGSTVPDPSMCTPPPAACSIVLSIAPKPPTPQPYTITYSWNGTPGTPLDRQVEGNDSVHIATSVSAFSWHMDGRTVVVSLTVTVRPWGWASTPGSESYSESQTWRFYPQVTP